MYQQSAPHVQTLPKIAVIAEEQRCIHANTNSGKLILTLSYLLSWSVQNDGDLSGKEWL